MKTGAIGGDRVRPGSDATRMAVVRVEKILRLRRQIFPESLFSDPAWDLMIALCKAHISQERLSVLRLARRADVPPSTTLRQVNALVERDLVIRSSDPLDSRRVF